MSTSAISSSRPCPPRSGADPVLVEVTRGGVVESVHHGIAVLCDASGRVVEAWGDVDRPVFPRSSVKPIQALPLLETGAAARFELSDAEIALACASHSGEPQHVKLVTQWLARVGLDETDLECGAHAPTNPTAARQILKSGQDISALHNNCSGKHAGFLTTACHRGEPTLGYIDADHPVQQRVTETLAEMTGVPASQGMGTDGCGIPTFAIPLAALATAMARMADPSQLAPERAAAVRRIRQAMALHPHLVAGTGKLDTVLMQAVPGIITKGGAEGVHIAILPDRGLGLALKILDGATRAADVALLALLQHMGVLSETQHRSLAARMHPPVLNCADRVVGMVQPAPDWLG